MRLNKKLFLGYISIVIITILTGYLLGKYSLQGVYEFTKKKELTNQMNKLSFSEINTGNLQNIEEKLGVDIIAYSNTKEYNIKEKDMNKLKKEFPNKNFEVEIKKMCNNWAGKSKIINITF